MRSESEVADEIAKLKAIKPPAVMGDVIRRRIALVIAELESPGQAGDDTHWPTVAATWRWLTKETNTRPSENWSSVVAINTPVNNMPEK